MDEEIILICSDRDGTINLDENYYLGSSDDWKEKIKFLPGVVEGIKKINSIVNSKFVIITNQSGVALADKHFENLTESRMHEVNEEIIKRLNAEGAKVDTYFANPFVDNNYHEKAKSKGRSILEKYLHDNHPDLKPNIGMFEKAAQKYGKHIDEIKHKFMIGDRASDIMFGLNAGCVSIFIESYKTKELGDLQKVLEMQKKNSGMIIIANDFLEACKYIKNKII